MDEEDDDLYGTSEPATKTKKEPKKEEGISSGDEPMDEGADSGDDDDDSDSVRQEAYMKIDWTDNTAGPRIHYRQASDRTEAIEVRGHTATLSFVV